MMMGTQVGTEEQWQESAVQYVEVPGVVCFFFFFFNDTATTEIYTLSLHDALPIYGRKTNG